jgi:hypothetical protein
MWRRLGVLGPAAVVALVCVAAIAVKLHSYGGNATGFVQFGAAATRIVHPPPGAYILDGSVGYDGQFYYVLAAHPEIDHHVREAFAGAQYRVQRIAYPALAAVTSLGSSSVLPWSLLAVNLLAAVGLTLVSGWWLRSIGRSAWWALAIGLAPGVLLCLLRDLTDVVGLAALLAGLAWWSAGRWRLAAAALAVAVLSRETALLALAAIGYDALRRRRAGDPAHGWQWVVGVPLLAFIGWETYATLRLGGTVPLGTAPASLWQPPGVGLTDALGTLARQSPAHAVWDLGFAGLTVAAVIAALAQLARSRHWLVLLTAGQALLTALLGSVFWLDHWSFTRATLPLFALLLISGLRTRSWVGPAVVCAAAAFTLAVPLALGTSEHFRPAAALLGYGL